METHVHVHAGGGAGGPGQDPRVRELERQLEDARRQLQAAQAEKEEAQAEKAEAQAVARDAMQAKRAAEAEAARYRTMASEALAIAEKEKQRAGRLEARLLDPASASASVYRPPALPPAMNPAVAPMPAPPVEGTVVAVEQAGGVAHGPRDGRDPALAGIIAAACHDETLPPGTRVCIPGRGVGTYQRFSRNTFGANAHTIDFDQSGRETLELRQLCTEQSHWVVDGGILYAGAVFRVENAGTIAVNGFYRVIGQYSHDDSHPQQYCKVDDPSTTIKQYSVARQWSIESDGTKYRNNAFVDASPKPPTGGWEAVPGSGRAPAPRLVYGPWR